MKHMPSKKNGKGKEKSNKVVIIRTIFDVKSSGVHRPESIDIPRMGRAGHSS